jgi:hypothetical protein
VVEVVSIHVHHLSSKPLVIHRLQTHPQLCREHGGEQQVPTELSANDNELIYQGLLDFSRDFDVALMDMVVTAFYTGAGQEVP